MITFGLCYSQTFSSKGDVIVFRFMVFLQLDAAAPVLAGLNEPIVIAKVDADKYRRLASKYEIEYVVLSLNFSVESWMKREVLLSV